MAQLLEMLESVGVNCFPNGKAVITETTEKIRNILDQIGYPNTFDHPELLTRNW